MSEQGNFFWRHTINQLWILKRWREFGPKLVMHGDGAVW